MRVAVDARHLGSGRGVARHLEAMLAALGAGHPGHEWVAVAPGSGPVAVPVGVRLRRPRAPRLAAFAAAALTGEPALERLAGGADVCWIPAPAPVAVADGTPYVLTIHDRSFEARPRDFTAYERAWHRLARPRRLAARAARVVAVSDATRADLLAAGWPIDPARMRVIHEGPGLPVAAPGGGEPPDPRVPARYMLAIGALEPRKGVATLVAAVAQARAAGFDMPVVVAGEGRLAGLLDGAPGIVALGRVTDARLDALLRDAQALVHPAVLEGFGLPPLEAAARGVPSIVADLPVYAETLGDAAVRVAPGDPAALAAAMRALREDPERRARLGREALEAVRPLTWERAADALVRVLEEAAG